MSRRGFAGCGRCARIARPSPRTPFLEVEREAETFFPRPMLIDREFARRKLGGAEL